MNLRRTSGSASFLLGSAILSIAACSSAPTQRSDFGDTTSPDGGNGATTTRTGDDAGTDDSRPGFNGGNGGTPGDAGPTTSCVPSPGNFEIPKNGCDDDGDGQVDNVTTCDQGLDAAGDANAFAKALGLCKTASGPTDKSWGVVSATYTRGYQRTDAPADGQHGILTKFGNVLKPQEGASLGVLSSGYAREWDDASDTSSTFKDDWHTMVGKGTAPPGFPKAASGCPKSSTVNDVADVKLQIKVPDNAQGIAIDFNFFSGEWPEWVCSEYNDGFIAYLSSQAFNGGKPDNISFDKNQDPVSVNNGFFDRCTPNTPLGCQATDHGTSTCPGGESELGGTGFEDRGSYCGNDSVGGGATGWLNSQAPVKPGEVITLELMIWDTGDSHLDSSVLLDHITWIPTPTTTGTTRPPPPIQ